MTKQRDTFGNINVHMISNNLRDVKEPGCLFTCRLQSPDG